MEKNCVGPTPRRTSPFDTVIFTFEFVDHIVRRVGGWPRSVCDSASGGEKDMTILRVAQGGGEKLSVKARTPLRLLTN